MGGVCCTERERPADLHTNMEHWLARSSRTARDFKVVCCSIRGLLTLVRREFKEGDVMVQELPIALLYAQRDPPWLAALRREIVLKDAARAWHYCLATHCLAAADLPRALPEGLRPLDDEEAAKVMELLPDHVASEAEPPTEVARITARHVLSVVREQGGEAGVEAATEEEHLALRLDAVAARVARNGLQIKDAASTPPLTADALFFRASVVNSCHGGAASAAWEFDGKRKTLTVRALRALVAGDEVTFDAASRAWAGHAASPKSSRPCACTACCHPSRSCLSARTGHGLAVRGSELPTPREVAGGGGDADGQLLETKTGELASRAAYASGSTEPGLDESQAWGSMEAVAEDASGGAPASSPDSVAEAAEVLEEAPPQPRDIGLGDDCADGAAAAARQEAERLEREAAERCGLEADAGAEVRGASEEAQEDIEPWSECADGAAAAARQEAERLEREAAKRCRLEALLSKWGSEYIETPAAPEAVAAAALGAEAADPDDGFAAQQGGEDDEDVSAAHPDRVCKLDTLLREWGGDYVDQHPGPTTSGAGVAKAMGDTVTASTMAGATTTMAGATTTMADTATSASDAADGPTARLLRRCEAEGLEVPREHAERLLQDEEGHIGKTMIILRRTHRRASP